jgi:peptidoglycan/xylan/chitin deacetylase (PgdA/CDA1 family)
MRSFLRQVDVLEEHCRVVSLAELLSEGPFTDRLHVAITFDDGYRGAVELALPELARRRLPSTLFVAPGLLGQRSFWWDEVADPEAGLSDKDRRHALEGLEGRQDQVRPWRSTFGAATALPDCYACATDAQVRDLHKVGEVTLGAHSWSHPNLSRIDPMSLKDELRRPLEWLRETGAPMLSSMAYPYGLSSPAVETAAKLAGYEAGLLVEGGWLTRREARWQLPRFNVPAGLSEDGFLLRLSGVLRLPSAPRDR